MLKAFTARRVLVFAAALGVAAGAGIATAAITSSTATSTIVACQHKGNGTLRIVANAAACNANSETAISWNATGPAGPAGPAGATGPAAPGRSGGSHWTSRPEGRHRRCRYTRRQG